MSNHLHSLSDVPVLQPLPGGAPIAPESLGNLRILCIDMERLPGLTRQWQSRTDGYTAPGNWERWPSTLSYAAKWYGDDRIMFEAAWTKGGEEGLLRKAWRLYDQADLVLSYNGQNFDNKHFRSGWLTLGMAPPSPWKDVDLLKTMRSQFGFEAKGLDPVCKRLGLESKSGAYKIDLALAAYFGDREARRELRVYNEGDVLITEALFDRIRPWLKNMPHLGRVLADGSDVSCPRCGSHDFKRNGTGVAQVLVYQRYRCLHCGGNFDDRRHLRQGGDGPAVRIGRTKAA